MLQFLYTIKWPTAILKKGRSFLQGVGEVPKREFLHELEKLKHGSGAFIAAPSPDYEACWIRDQLYCTLSYYYIGNTPQFQKGLWLVFDIFHKYRGKIDAVICNQPKHGHEYIHAKVHPETLEEITHEWGHHQLDTIGLFLYIVAFAHREGITVIRDENDKEMLQLLVFYLRSVRYWEFPDNGMWEEGYNLHASSIGAVVAGLTLLKERKLAVVPVSLIASGHKMLHWLLPNESPDCDVDMAQLSLLFPYKGVITSDMESLILERVKTKLVQKRGLNRYWDDKYFRSDNGVSGEWPMGRFWLSIIYSARGDKKEARFWFNRGCAAVTPEGYIPELYQNGKPNEHTPLAWAHAMALVAEAMLKQ